jgi:nitrite reductase/ring-hydroxylating ferredoxin subunit
MSGEVKLFVIGAASAIARGEAKAYSLSRIAEDGDSKPFSIFVARAQDDQYFGYLNACPHQGAWLNIGDGRFFTQDGERLRCGRHRSEFDIDSGVCSKGPCKDSALEPVPVVVVDGELCICGMDLSEEEPRRDDELEDTMEIMIHP